ncbi:MAG: methionyl-tRNA formyltransferase [Acidobacteria bacterium]|nr:methionyl-tRNA formyltransferase [Acidobacteriota bacterium]
MKIVFAGSPKFAIPTLQRLVAGGHEMSAVYTQPDRPVGREQKLHPPPVKEAALRLGLRVEQPERIRRDEPRAILEGLQPDVMIVVGYGQILPPWLLELPRYGCINLHASLLPAYRGAAPIQWAIANGETITGNTTMLMDPGMDTGPALLQWETAIGPDETSPELAERMSVAGADLMMETLDGVVAGRLHPQRQDDSRASKAPLLKKEDGLIDWAWSATRIYNRLRGFTPWPGIYTEFRNKRLVITSARPAVHANSGAALPVGTIANGTEGVLVACGEQTILQVVEVQLEGRRRMSAREFMNGAQITPGEQFGAPV